MWSWSWRRRVLRALVFGACTIALWVVVSPASAAAPLCDDRGAIGFAPAPTLQDPVSSLDIGDAGDRCDVQERANQILPGHGGPESRSCSDCGDPQTLLSRRMTVYAAAPLGVLPSSDPWLLEGHGVRVRVERPPRG